MLIAHLVGVIEHIEERVVVDGPEPGIRLSFWHAVSRLAVYAGWRSVVIPVGDHSDIVPGGSR